MRGAEQVLTRCEQCGALLQDNQTDVGCLNCLLIGGLSDLDAESRRFQHYEICLREDGVGLRELGRGAMGVTYRAIDLNLGSSVALKVIGGAFSENPAARERFKREARTAAQLRHSNVASVFHFGETATGHCFYAMELVEGETLEERVRRGGPLPASAALQVVAQVVEALVAAETHGLVHRDLKPSNIMVMAHQASDKDALTVKVIDFGLAKAVSTGGDDQDQSPITFSGTPGFASPEQLNGGDTAIDSRSDIYSLGATLWYLLCGYTPFATGRADALPIAQLKAAHVPAPVVLLLRLMLAPEPARRPQTARELLNLLQGCRYRVEARPRRKKRLTLVALALLALVVGGLTSRFRRTHELGPVVPAKSIAVLPFENLSDGKENSFFASGMQDEILSDLAKIADLKVISRASVMKYKSASERNLGEIAKVLGVSHVVEGSVQRAGDRIRITVQLIDARTDHHLWADHYDRNVTDVFAIQSEIAQQIANQLQSKLSSAERTAITERPTADLKAYELYTAARAIDVWSDWQGAEKSMARQVELLEQATQRDPTFALAWCALAKTQCDLADNLDPAHLELARKAADAAFRLRPDLGEVHRELARYYYYADDFAHAYEELTIALRTLPNDSETFRIAAETNRHRNRWDEALANFQKARELDPRNEEVTYHLGFLYREMRRYEEWENLIKKEIASEPGSDPWSEMALAEIKLDEGDPVAAQALLAKVPLDFSPTDEIWHTRCTTALYLRDYDEASRLIAAAPAKFTGGVLTGSPREKWGDGLVARFRGDQSKAHAVFTGGCEKFKAAWGDKTRNHRYFARVAAFDAGLGRKQDAIEEARRAVDLMPITTDSTLGPWLVRNLAMVYAWTGERDLAIEQLEIIAKVPGGPTYGELRFDPTWDSLRGDLRFEKVIAALAPKSVIQQAAFAVPEKSIAVLPFENLSDDKQSSYFAGGVQDEILSGLAKIADLRVISRTSVMQYKSGSPRNVREIGKALGVAHVLEGSVQSLGNRVRINAQLIDARNDAHLWAQTYDREATDVFAIQSEIASEIANQLRAKLSPAERAAITERPTADLEAYKLYNEAKSLELRGDWKDVGGTKERRVELLTEAIRRDPNFVQAYLLLAKVYSHLSGTAFLSGRDHSAVDRRWKQAIDTAMRLRPDLGEPHVLRARYYCFHDEFDRAREELAVARPLLPNDADAFHEEARVDRRQNRWDAALANLRRANELDPRNGELITWTCETYRLMRRYYEGEQFINQAMARMPELTSWLYALLARSKLDEGDLPKAHTILTQVPPDVGTETRFNAALYQRDYDAATQIIAAAPAEVVNDRFGGEFPLSGADAQIARARGDTQKAQAAFLAARKRFETMKTGQPKDQWYFTDLAPLDAGLGRKADAIREARQAVAIVPLAKDALFGTHMACTLALVYAWTGEPDLAIEQLELLASIPSDVSYGDLHFNPRWDSLRGNPRFEKVVASLAPKAMP